MPTNQTTNQTTTAQPTAQSVAQSTARQEFDKTIGFCYRLVYSVNIEIVCSMYSHNEITQITNELAVQPNARTDEAKQYQAWLKSNEAKARQLLEGLEHSLEGIYELMETHLATIERLVTDHQFSHPLLPALREFLKDKDTGKFFKTATTLEEQGKIKGSEQLG